jgi:hypothetical protein
LRFFRAGTGLRLFLSWKSRTRIADAARTESFVSDEISPGCGSI